MAEPQPVQVVAGASTQAPQPMEDTLQITPLGGGKEVGRSPATCSSFEVDLSS